MTCTPRSDRKAVAERLVTDLLPFIEEHGTPVICKGRLSHARPIQAWLPGLYVIYCPEASRLTNAAPLRTIDIWLDGESRGKVFSAGLEPFVLHRLNNGGWVNDLLAFLNRR